MASLRRTAALGLGTSVILGGSFMYGYTKSRNERERLTAAAFHAKQNQKELDQAFAGLQQRRNLPETVFYRQTNSPLCTTVKAFLDYNDISHTCVEVDPVSQKQIEHSEYKRLPQLRFNDGPYLVESLEIINTLAVVVGAGAQLKDEGVNAWRLWARVTLLQHMSLNTDGTLADAWHTCDYVDAFDTIPYANKMFFKLVGAPMLYWMAQYETRPALIASGEITEGSDVRSVLHQQVAKFVDDGLKDTTPQKPFHGGAKPDLADLDVYGVFQSIRGHRVYDDILRSTQIGAWMNKMDAVTKKQPYILEAAES